MGTGQFQEHLHSMETDSNGILTVKDKITKEVLMRFKNDDANDSIMEAYFQGYAKGMVGGKAAIRREILTILGIMEKDLK